MYLDRVEANWPVRLSIDVGTHVPLHCTSSGKLLLANLSSRKRRDLVHKLALQRHTDKSIIDPNVLLAECKMIVSQGYAVESEEFVPGLISIAVPIRDCEDTVRATLSLHAPVAQMSPDEAVAHLDAFRQAAREMSKLIQPHKGKLAHPTVPPILFRGGFVIPARNR